MVFSPHSFAPLHIFTLKFSIHSHKKKNKNTTTVTTTVTTTTITTTTEWMKDIFISKDTPEDAVQGEYCSHKNHT